MSISNLEVPNGYNLYANSLTLTEGINVGSNQIYWSSFSATTSGNFIGSCGEVATFPNARAVTNNQITIRSLRVLLSAPPGAGQSWTYTLYVNGSATPLSIIISGTATTATNTSNNVTLNPGDTFAVGLTSTGGATSGFSTICMNYF